MTYTTHHKDIKNTQNIKDTENIEKMCTDKYNYLSQKNVPTMAQLHDLRHHNDGVNGIEFDAFVLFLDIRGSTLFFDQYNHSEIAKTLHIYYETIIHVIAKYDGQIRSISGDSILVFFAGNSQRVASRVVSCAYALQEYIMSTLNPILQNKGYPSLDFGIGIAHDMVTAILVGSEHIFHDVFWIGRGVNMAAKISDLGQSPDHIHISERVYQQLQKNPDNATTIGATWKPKEYSIANRKESIYGLVLPVY